MKPYIFGHRGASGYEIENIISAFKKTVSMGKLLNLIKDQYK